MMRKWTVRETSAFSVQVTNKNGAVASFILKAESVGLDGTVSNHGSGALTYVWNKINGRMAIQRCFLNDKPAKKTMLITCGEKTLKSLKNQGFQSC